MLEINVDFENAVQNWQKICSFLDNFIWIGYLTVSLLPRKYFSSGDNVLRNSLKILNTTKKDFSQLNVSQSDEQRLSNYCRKDFSSVWDPLTCWLS